MPVNPFAVTAPEGAYVHVPFCASRCLYCDFYSKRPQADDFRLYTESILAEIKSEAALARRRFGGLKPLRSLYFGGGTPAFLPLRNLALIFRAIADEFGLAPDCECTVEANPDKALPRKLAGLREIGFNRLSIGLQSADDRLLKRIGRLHDRADFECSLQSAVYAGFHNISADLIFGLPGQTVESFLRDCRYLFGLPVQHLSFYSLQLEEGTALAEEAALNPLILPSEEEEREMYHRLLKILPAAGFRHYEISNAGREGFFSRHNLLYWNARPYYAFGPAAASYAGGVRASRPEDLYRWAERARADGNQWDADEIIDAEEARYEYAMLRLRLREGLGFDKYNELFGRDAKTDFGTIFASLVRKGLLRVTEDSARLSERGLDFANLVFQAFVRGDEQASKSTL